MDDLIHHALATEGRLIPDTEEAVATMEAILETAPVQACTKSARVAFAVAQRRLGEIVSSHAGQSNDTRHAAQRLLQQIGSSSLHTAAAAASGFLALGTRSHTVIRAIESKLRVPMTASEKAALLKPGHQLRVMADCDARAELPVSEAVDHLWQSRHALLLAGRGDRQADFRRAGCRRRPRFTATWLAFPGETYVFLIRCEGA